MSLDAYRQKRDFKRSPEPAPRVRRSRSGRRYVIQKHAASRLHYDFRLELDGVLKSWAIPKGPSPDPAQRRLAMQVEDHPLEYADFEGVIPEGEYGGGTVMIWDYGRWEPDGDPAQGYKQGKLTFRLEGERLRGRWHLVRMAGRRASGDNQRSWLLVKERDKTGRPAARGDSLDKATSARTGRTMQKIARDRDRVWTGAGESADETRQSSSPRKASATRKKTPKKGSINVGALAARLEKAGARPGPLPHPVQPELALLSKEIPTGEPWIHEIKYDGYRMLAEIADGRCRLISRNGLDWTARFPTLAAQLSALPVHEALLDGELVRLGPGGKSSFQALQNTVKDKRERELKYFVFDLLHLEGRDARPAPLAQRKSVLADLLAPWAADPAGAIRYSDHYAGDGKAFFEQACGHSLEGVVAKRMDRPYRSGRNGDWVKIKCGPRQEFVIGGWTDPAGGRSGLGALLVGYYEGQDLVYAGRVGTGFDERTLKDLRRRLEPLARNHAPFRDPPKRRTENEVHWVKPELVAEVAYGNWTQDGILRHPSFKGLREDKAPREVARERPLAAAPDGETSKTHPSRRPLDPAPRAKPAGLGNAEIAGVRLTHPGRVVYPEQGITKQALAEYYASVADWILPHAKGRPLTLVRCPQGRGGKCFYQKHLQEDIPCGLHGVAIREKEEDEVYVVLDDAAGLIALVQLGALELHIWGSREQRLEQPDRLVFDLDPGPGLAWETVRAGALAVRALMREHGLESFVKTTGGKGLHVVVPLTPAARWERCKQFVGEMAEECARRNPEMFTVNMSKARRAGKIYLDYLRNGRGATSVAPYSTRARPGATVSTPLSWTELSRLKDPAKFTAKTLPARLKRLKKDPWAGFFETAQRIK